MSAENAVDYSNEVNSEEVTITQAAGEQLATLERVVALNFLRGVEIDYATRETGATFVFNNVFQVTGGSGLCGACGAAVGAGGGCG